jgi:Mg-chelatase subunit ChlD
MRVVKLVLVILGLLLLIGGVSASQPDYVVISTDTPWLVAGGTATATIQVRVVNASQPAAPVIGANVSVLWSDPQIGTILAPTSKKIDASSQYVSFTFKPGTKSGDAVISVTVTNEGKTVNGSVVQKVDHADPKKWSLLTYPYEGTVSYPVDITVRMNDTYNNIIENRNIAETVLFRATDGTDGGFWNGSGYASNITIAVGSDGNATVHYLLPSSIGSNMIQITAPRTVNPAVQWIVIRGVAGFPGHISSEVYPATGLARANNEDTFTIIYTIRDTLGNPVINAPFWRNTTIGESDRFITNDEGMVITTYGPKGATGVVTITAAMEGYPLVNTTDVVEFVHTDPVMWVLTASPQTLASRDVKSDLTADIKAKVMDILGNPTENETVTFAIVNTTGTTAFSIPPELVQTSAETNPDGFAIVQFRPGAFPLYGEPGYSQNATGTATVRATWNGNTKDILIIFKNYPYLRVETFASPETIAINETVDVTVRLVGDGWALHSKPIDVVLVTDRSGSMLKDEPDDRMIPVMSASRDFATTMDLSQSQDHLGLVSFGVKGWAKIAPTRSGGSWDWSNIYGGQYGSTPLRDNPGWWWVAGDNSYNSTPGSYSSSSVHQAYVNAHYPANPRYYNDYAVLEVPLNWSPSAINTSINSMVPAQGTPLRSAIYTGINEISAHGRTDAVRALVVLSDGDYNWYGDPLARGSGSSSTPCSDPTAYSDLTSNYCKLSGLTSSTQNMSNYAKSKNVRIYSIGYASDISSGGKNTLRILAESTGGKYYDGNAANIETIYQAIAGELKDVAGVNTVVNLSFQNLNVTYNNVTSFPPGDQVFDYQYVNGISTWVDSWNTSADHLYGFPFTLDQTASWENSHTLNFSAGNISLNQTWETTFRFMALTPGSISVFGPGSVVNFGGDGEVYSVPMPDTYITSVANLTPQMESQALVDVKDLGVIDFEENKTDMLTIQWTLNYTGNETANQLVYYQYSRDNIVWSNDWIHTSTLTTGNGPLQDINYTARIDVRDVHGYYLFRVTAKENILGGAYDEERMIQPVLVNQGQGYIRIE